MYKNIVKYNYVFNYKYKFFINKACFNFIKIEKWGRILLAFFKFHGIYCYAVTIYSNI